jgi:transposase
MVKRTEPDAKRESLVASRTLNPHPETVTAAVFAGGGFFDPRDLVQVKYEMLRQVEVEDVPVSRAAAAFGFSRQSLYTARAVLAEQGLAGLVPGKPGPKQGHKLTEVVIDHLEELLAADPAARPGDLAAAVAERFDVTVHPRSVQRALARRQAQRQARQEAPKSQ